MANRLLARKQFVLEVIHPGNTNVSKVEDLTTPLPPLSSALLCFMLHGS
jgi:hypothetical protein